MSTDERDAIIGRVLREHREKTEELCCLTAKAAAFGNELCLIGQTLIEEPNALVAPGDGFKTEVVGSGPVTFNSEPLDVKAIAKLTREIRECMETLSRLEARKTTLGI